MSISLKKHTSLLTTTALLGTLAVFSSNAQAACPVMVYDQTISGASGAVVVDTATAPSLKVDATGAVNNGAGVGISSAGTSPLILCVEDGGTVTGLTQAVVNSTTDASITNQGSITGTNFVGIWNQNGGTVDNQSTGTISAGNTAIFTENANGSVTNAGSITGTNAVGVWLADGGTVDNLAGGTVLAGTTGIYLENATGSVTNAGSITGTNAAGVWLVNGGTVDNQAGGTILSATAGISIGITAGTVTNGGSITSNTATGVWLKMGGSVDNQAGGTIMGGGNYGVHIEGAEGTVINAGTITGTNAAGVWLVNGGTVDNQAGGTILSATAGISIGITAGTVTNGGSITSNTATGVWLKMGGSVDNQAGGTIMGGGNYGVHIEGAEGSVTNAGSITGTTLDGVTMFNGGTVDNQVGGTILGNNFGILTLIADGTVTNAGSITGVNRTGVWMNAGGSTNNLASGVILGSEYGVYSQTGSVGTVTNAGSITSTGLAGVLLWDGLVENLEGGVILGANGGVHINGAGASVINAGSISGTNFDGVTLWAGGTVNNQASGTISGNWSGIDILGGTGTVINAGSITGGDGVSIFGTGTVDNLAGGTITGNDAALRITGGVATVTNAGVLSGDVIFGTSDDSLSLLAGSTLNGDADGGDGVDSLTISSDHTLGVISNFETASISDGTVAWNDVSANLTNLTVSNANLSFGGTTANTVSIDATSTLSGSGTFAGLNISGMIAPGNSAGTLSIAGDFTMAATATYQAEIFSNGTSDLIDVGGAATLDGTLEIDIVDAAADYDTADTFTLVSAAGGINGDFADVIISGGTATLYAMHNVGANDVTVNFINPTVFFGGVGGTDNQKAATNVLAGLAVSSDDAQSLFNADAATINDTLEQLNGSTHATMANILATDGTKYLNVIMSQAIGTHSTSNGQTATGNFDSWMTFYGSTGTATTDGNARGYELDTKAVGFGIGYALNEDITVGLHGGHSWSNATLGTDQSEAKSKEFGVYVAGRLENIQFVGAYSHGWHDITMSRLINFAGIAINDTDTKSNKFQLEVSYPIVLDQLTIAPVVGYSRTVVNGIALQETGAGAANLNGTTAKFTSS